MAEDLPHFSSARIETPEEARIDNSPRVRRIIQMVDDHVRLAGKPMSQIRLLDLACAHGQYTLEFARRGATTLGIEGRQAWVDHANLSKSQGGFKNVEFQLGDVRNLDRDVHGGFDVVLCLGLLYHLNTPDCFDLLARIHEACDGFVIIDTQIALNQRDLEDVMWRGNSYHGWRYREHAVGATPQQKTATLGASLDDDFSFWLTRPSLFNALSHIGFTSVYECRVPLDCMYAHGEMKMHADFVTLLAIKGEPIREFVGDTGARTADWPEDVEAVTLKRPWSSLVS